MFRFIKKMFVAAMSLFSYNTLNCVSMNNQECKVRTEIMNINSNEPSFYLYSVKIRKCNGRNNVIMSMIHMQNYVFLMLVKT